MWELVVIWDTGEKTIYTYDSREVAERSAYNLRFALGMQVAWWCVRKKV